MSSISWLDTSTEEQTRMREILGLFTEKESREELGLGQIRDAVADGLFPGTSTLHTRAKYLLFVPWIFQYVSAQGGTAAQARKQELALIRALKTNGRNDRGVIGSEAGSTLKTVPSSVYWSALGVYGILTDPKLNKEQAIALEGARPISAAQAAGSDSQRTLHHRAWRSSLPEPPPGFPAEIASGMALSHESASWLQERILDSASGSLLAHLVVHAPDSDSDVPWEDVVALTADGEARRWLEHARRFSNTMQGAQLLYNLLIAESYEAEGFTQFEGRREYFAQLLTEWSEEYFANAARDMWDVDQFFWMVTTTRRSKVASGSEAFVRGWADLLQTPGPRNLVTDETARRFVRDRERRNKGVMARIGNRKRLETWGGSSGAGRYVYRWGYVQTVLRDIHEGLEAAGAFPVEPLISLQAEAANV